MKDEELKWKVLDEKKTYSTPICEIYEQKERQFNGQEGIYIGIDAPAWVLIVAARDDKFILVKQFRHAYQDISVEFPGGVCEEKEKHQETAYRELLEETGYKAGKLTLLAELSPNPAIMRNRVYFYLAEQLEKTGKLSLDSDEYLNVVEVPIDEVIANIGNKPYVHAFLATAIMLYLRHKNDERYLKTR